MYCSNRGNNKTGCGKTFSILYSDCIKYFSIRAKELWSALRNIATGIPIYKAFEGSSYCFSENYPYSLWRIFKLNCSHIRSYLDKKRGPPDCCSESCPYITTILDLEQTFPDSKCPVSTFQESNNAPFFKS